MSKKKEKKPGGSSPGYQVKNTMQILVGGKNQDRT